MNNHALRDVASEQRATFDDHQTPFVVDGVFPTVPASSLTLGMPETTAYVSESGQHYYIDQAAASVTVPDSPLVWIALHRLTTEDPVDWTREGLTHWIVQAVAMQPAIPEGALLYAQAVVAGSVITEVIDISKRRADGVDDVERFESFAAAVAAYAGGPPVTLRLTSRTQVATSVDVTSNISLVIPYRGMLDIADTVKVTIDGTLTAGTYQIKTGPGMIAVGVNGTLVGAVPQWFGAVTGNVVDCTAAIQEAWDLGGEQRLPRGTYKTTATLTALPTPQNGLTIRGEGKYASIIHYQPAAAVLPFDMAMWFGNTTQDTPVPFYQLEGLSLSDFGIYVNEFARVGMRMREALSCYVKNLFIGAEPDLQPTDFIALYCDAMINCRYEEVELATNDVSGGATTCLVVTASGNLDRSAGSGSGASPTSSSFHNSYIHRGSNLISLSQANQLSFDDCVLEAGTQTGVVVGTGFLSSFDNCYFEAITGPAIHAAGTSQALPSNLIVRGGYYNGSGQSGYTTGPFLRATNAGKIDISGMQMNGGDRSIGRIVETLGFTHSVQMDAKPFSSEGTESGFTPFALTNPFSTTLGDSGLSVNQPGHPMEFGDTVGIHSFTNIVNNVRLNLPFWRVISITNVDNYLISPITTERAVGAYTANATQAGVGGSGALVRYTTNAWVNSTIDSPNKTRFNDADLIPIRFSRAFTTGYADLPYYLDGNPALTEFVVPHWAYLMYAVRSTSANQTALAANSSIIRVNHSIASAYDPGPLNMSLNSGEIPINALIGPPILVGKKIPPATTIYGSSFKTDAVGGVNYDVTDTLTIYLAICNDDHTNA